jgi:hypothetical protein
MYFSSLIFIDTIISQTGKEFDAEIRMPMALADDTKPTVAHMFADGVKIAPPKAGSSYMATGFYFDRLEGVQSKVEIRTLYEFRSATGEQITLNVSDALEPQFAASGVVSAKTDSQVTIRSREYNKVKGNFDSIVSANFNSRLVANPKRLGPIQIGKSILIFGSILGEGDFELDNYQMIEAKRELDQPSTSSQTSPFSASKRRKTTDQASSSEPEPSPTAKRLRAQKFEENVTVIVPSRK